jgi:hypothetical protein
MQKSFVLVSIGIFSIAFIGGCNNAKSPDAVAQDVAAAQQKASAEVDKSEKDAAKDVGNAAEKVDTKLTDLNNTAAKDAYKITLAQADGDRKVALAKCDALSGDAQKNCRSQTDADYEAAKANAKAAQISDKQ